MTEALIQKARKIFHSHMLSRNVLTLTKDGTASNADSASSSSKAIALRTAEIISDKCGQKISVMNKVSGQTLGRQFEVLVSEFLCDTFLNLDAIRPGKWIVRRAGSGIRTSDFAQYKHLELLSKIVNENPKLAS